ncbi:Poxvirus Late Transcription Factor VLTF3 like domain protein [Mollivirus kamchatka]|nr:Poxvirus Late Transcription Factor VLTF3 like domain protein [Mollivirus kamchatka]
MSSKRKRTSPAGSAGGFSKWQKTGKSGRAAKPKTAVQAAAALADNPVAAAEDVVISVLELIDVIDSRYAGTRQGQGEADLDSMRTQALVLREKAERSRGTREGGRLVGKMLEEAARIEARIQDLTNGSKHQRERDIAIKVAVECRKQADLILAIAGRAADRARHEGAEAVAPRWFDPPVAKCKSRTDLLLAIAGRAADRARHDGGEAVAPRWVNPLEVLSTAPRIGGGKRPPLAVVRCIQDDRLEALDRLALAKFYHASLEAVILGKPAPIFVNDRLAPVDRCQGCRAELLLTPNGALRLCLACCEAVQNMDCTAASMSYGEEVEMSRSSYQRQHYFNEWLRREGGVGGGAGTKPDPATVEGVSKHLRLTEGMSCIEEVTMEDVNRAYKAIGYVPPAKSSAAVRNAHDKAVLRQLRGEDPPDLTWEQKIIVRVMFRAIQAPYRKWMEVVDPERSQFIHYSLCLDMFFLLLGWTGYLPFYGAIRGYRELVIQLAIFKGICRELKWQFIVAPHLIVVENAASRKRKAAAQKRLEDKTSALASREAEEDGGGASEDRVEDEQSQPLPQETGQATAKA